MKRTCGDKHIDDTERHIKMFLSSLKYIDNCFSLNEKKSMFETTANLTGLLNIPDYMRCYGPLGLYWEGGHMGEGIIKYIKPCITQGTYKNTFSYNALKRFYKDKFYQTLTNLDLEEEDEEDRVSHRYTEFRTYKSITIVKGFLQCDPFGTPLSVVILKDGRICVSCMKGSVHTAVALNLRDDIGAYWNGTWITNIEVGSVINIHRIDLLDEKKVFTYGMVLPCISEKAKKLVSEKKEIITLILNKFII